MTDESGSRIEAAVALYKNEGLHGVAAGIEREIRRTVPALTSPPHQANRTDVNERWALIESELDDSDHSLLDIGCNAGLITARAADSGRFALGVDIDEDALDYVDHGYEDGLALAKTEVSPDTIESLPRADVVLCLSVLQQWGNVYGWDATEDMVASLAELGDSVFVEISPYKTELSHPRGDSGDVEYYRDALSALFGGAEVNHVAEVSTTASAKEPRQLYKIDTTGKSGESKISDEAQEADSVTMSSCESGDREVSHSHDR